MARTRSAARRNGRHHPPEQRLTVARGKSDGSHVDWSASLVVFSADRLGIACTLLIWTACRDRCNASPAHLITNCFVVQISAQKLPCRTPSFWPNCAAIQASIGGRCAGAVTCVVRNTCDSMMVSRSSCKISNVMPLATEVSGVCKWCDIKTA